MSDTDTSRRRFLKKSAVAAGLVASPPALALAAGSASGEALAPAVVDNNSLESVLYGRRSRFVTTTREIEGRSHSTSPTTRPVPQRPSARTPLASRPVTPNEVEEGVKMFEEFQGELGVDTKTALARYCLLLLNLNEFFFVD